MQNKYRSRYTLKIIGEGDYSDSLKEFIAVNNAGDVVDFENRFYSVDKLSVIIGGFDVGLVSYILSSGTQHMLPLKMMEYISVGLPVLTIRNSPIGYYFTEEDCFYYDPEKPETLNHWFNAFIEDKDLLDHGRNHVLTIRNRFLWNNEKRKYITLLENLINNE